MSSEIRNIKGNGSKIKRSLSKKGKSCHGPRKKERFLDDSGLGEPVFQLLKISRKFLVEYGVCLFSGYSKSDSSDKWEPVGTENGSVTDVLKLRGVS